MKHTFLALALALGLGIPSAQAQTHLSPQQKLDALADMGVVIPTQESNTSRADLASAIAQLIGLPTSTTFADGKHLLEIYSQPSEQGWWTSDDFKNGIFKPSTEDLLDYMVYMLSGSGDPEYRASLRPGLLSDPNFQSNFAHFQRQFDEQSVSSPADPPQPELTEHLQNLVIISINPASLNPESTHSPIMLADNNPGNDTALEDEFRRQLALQMPVDTPMTGLFSGSFNGIYDLNSSDISVGGVLNLRGDFANITSGPFTGEAIIQQGGGGSIDLTGINFGSDGQFSNNSSQVNSAFLGSGTNTEAVTSMLIWGEMQDSNNASGQWSMDTEGTEEAAKGGFHVIQK